MKQLRRREPAHEYMSRIIGIGQAAKVLSNMLLGETVTTQQQVAALAVYNKTVPSLQAVAIQVTDNTPQSKADIDGMLMLAGLEPDTHWDTIEGEAVQLKDVPE